MSGTVQRWWHALGRVVLLGVLGGVICTYAFIIGCPHLKPTYLVFPGAFVGLMIQLIARLILNERKTSVTTAPGSAFIRMVSLFFSKKTVERVFMQSVQDLREEYFDALGEKRFGWARWIRIRWYVSLLLTFVLQTGVSFAKKLQWMWKLH